MKKYFVLFIIFCSQLCYADSLDIKVNPERPVLNETFEVEFIVNSADAEDPAISFVPEGAEIVSRSQGAVSTRTSFINGKTTFSRSITIKYELEAKRAGTIYLQNIKADLGGKTLTHRNYAITVLRKAVATPDIFVRAEVEKDQVYVGESIVVRYYLYSSARTPLSTTDVKRFPKLDKFLKRYHQEKTIPERVQIDNNMFVRRIIYTAQLYAEKEGKYNIDPISLNVTYSDRGDNSFDSFGFGLRLGRTRRKSVQSKNLEISVLPLPSENMPSSFSGLVGKHKFKLVTSKKKYLSNEPIELQLIISGEGALELVETPKLLNHDLIEEFETNSDLKINPDFTAEKKFEYTYLGRGNVKFDEFNYPISYFDPETGQYMTENLAIGPLEVVAIGNVLPSKKIKKVDDQTSNATEVGNSGKVNQLGGAAKQAYFEPIYKSINSYIYYSKHLFYLIGISLLILLSFFTFKQAMRLKKKEKTLFEEIYSSGVSYGSLYRVLHLLAHKDSMVENINCSQLSTDSKQYFYELIETVNSRFDKEAKDSKFKIKKKYFQEIEALVKKNDNQDL